MRYRLSLPVLALAALALLLPAMPVFAQMGVKDLVKRELGQAQKTREEQAKEAGVPTQTPTPRPIDKPLTPAAGALAAADPTRSAGWIVVAAPDATPVRIFFSHPHLPASNLPALIVVQEWWGVTQDIQTRTNELAGKGYFSLAVDLYDGQATADPKKAAELKGKLTDTGALVRLKTGMDVMAELAKLKTVNADRTGVIGWCMGGEQALKLARAIPELAQYVVPAPNSFRVQVFMQLFGNNSSEGRRATTGILPHPGFPVEPAEVGHRTAGARCPWIGAVETRCGIARNFG